MAIVDDPVQAPPQPPHHRPNALLALLRNSWRQLTSMRTALILLFLLAVAAIPGSVLPQRGVNPEDVNGYFREHPDLAPVLDRIGAFEVFGSVWFSAIYLLLFTSLVGCIVPRLRDHVRALRAVPPAAPKRMDRLPQHALLTVPDADAATIAAVLRRRRWRVRVTGDEVSAEKGYLKETGNLLFHLSLIAVLVGVALGSWYGWHGNRLLVAGAENAFCNNRQQFSEAQLGPQVDAADLPRFCLTLTDFQARFLPSGQPESYNAKVDVEEFGRAVRPAEFSVNSPLRLDGANVYLLGHGYAPIIRYTDRFGQAQTTSAPFLSKDGMLTSEGIAAFPDANVDPATGDRKPDLQVAFEGLYLPTAPDAPPFTRSEHPEERNPAVWLIAYRGNLGLDAGIPGSVYELDQRQVRNGQLKQVGEGKLLRAGEKWTLDDGTTVEFLGTEPYITLSVRYDPGSTMMLASCAVLLLGLMGSLFGRRRRVWFRVLPGGATGGAPSAGGLPVDPAAGSTTGGSSLVQAGGLPRTEYPGFAAEFAELVAEVEGRRGPDDARDRDEKPEGAD
ncbi:cytochrome c biogenesis protein ResB [Micromonospora sp. CPCC 206060]|uniref:cytochrome c biogenesis protein ResB n=1 Tax=Micromonospora sp. CPCC 206060 TaxID=3122406 RepID=UPI002FEED37D